MLIWCKLQHDAASTMTESWYCILKFESFFDFYYFLWFFLFCGSLCSRMKCKQSLYLFTGSYWNPLKTQHLQRTQVSEKRELPCYSRQIWIAMSNEGTPDPDLWCDNAAQWGGCSFPTVVIQARCLCTEWRTEWMFSNERQGDERYAEGEEALQLLNQDVFVGT